VDGNPIKLTSLEYRLLAYLAHHKGQVLSRTDLVEHLYDQDFDRDSNTIEVFIGRLRKKLGVDVIHTMRGLGYRLDERGQAGKKAEAGYSRPNSLTFRLIAGAVVWSLLCLVAGGFVLSNIFRGSIQESFDDQLSFDLDGLIAAAEVDAPEHVSLQGRFADPRFERVFSGWYWQIDPDMPQSAEAQPETSRSLWDQNRHSGKFDPRRQQRDVGLRGRS
jgi:hypothetical protein